MDEQKLIHDPSQKVLAMYQAVIEFINEGCDINTLKVADITGRAGIGKGTAYEYFSSKEEIISSAILYYVKLSGNVWWRHHNGEWFLAAIYFCMEVTVVFPFFIKAFFNALWVIGLC